MVSGRTTGAKMAEQEDDFISLNPEEGESSGKEAADAGMEIYKTAKQRRSRAFYAVIIAALVAIGLCVGWFVENTENLAYIVFAVLVSFGSLALYLARGIRKFNDRVVDPGTASKRTTILGAIVTVLIVVGIPALVIWLYFQIDLPTP